MMPARIARVLLAVAVLVAGGCSEKAVEKKPGPPATLITTTEAKAVNLEVVETTLGTLESVLDPKVSAEVAGRVVKVNGRAGRAVRKGEILAEIAPDDLRQQQIADGAEVRRLESILAQQERLVARQKDLKARNFVSQNAVDEAQTQRDAAAAQISAARARLGLAENQMAKTRVAAPYDGSIVVQIVAPGDYVKVGDPLFQFVSNRRMRANLPFPEQVAGKIRVGQAVRLRSPQSPATTVEGVIEDIRPTLLAGSRAIEAIARFDNAGNLLSGGSVDASVVIAQREGAVVVPEQAVVLRPAGKVVFAIVDGKAEQRVVETGSKQGGVIEITKGLAAGTVVALDGAGFLSHGASVAVKEARAKGTAARPEGKPAEGGKPAADKAGT